MSKVSPFGIVSTYTPSTFFWSDPVHNVNSVDFANQCPSKITVDKSACEAGILSSSPNANITKCYNYELCKNYQNSTSFLQRSGTDGRYQDLRVQHSVAQLRLFNTFAGVVGMCVAIYYLRK
jgi:hypothetical protein